PASLLNSHQTTRSTAINRTTWKNTSPPCPQNRHQPHYLERKNLLHVLRTNGSLYLTAGGSIYLSAIALGTSATMTVFRKLKALGYRTSYSHRGKYYTLSGILRFD